MAAAPPPTTIASIPTVLNYRHKDMPDTYYPGTAAAYTIPQDKIPVHVHNARGHESDFSLDKQGFEFHQHTTHADFVGEDAARVRETYYPEVVELIKAKTGATRVIPVDHLLRSSLYEPLQTWAQSVPASSRPSTGAPGGKRVPARFVHVDQSYAGAAQWLRDNITDDAERTKLGRTRWGVINVWRPLMEGGVKRDPLAVCDGRTVREGELTEVLGTLAAFKEVSKGRTLPFWMLNRPEGREGDVDGVDGEEGIFAHRWYFLDGMQMDEVYFIKCFDSKLDGRCRRAPHSAFEDGRYVDDRIPRTSVEVRCLVFWEGEGAE